MVHEHAGGGHPLEDHASGPAGRDPAVDVRGGAEVLVAHPVQGVDERRDDTAVQTVAGALRRIVQDARRDLVVQEQLREHYVHARHLAPDVGAVVHALHLVAREVGRLPPAVLRVLEFVERERHPVDAGEHLGTAHALEVDRLQPVVHHLLVGAVERHVRRVSAQTADA